jgi:hypothetical protein
MAYDKERRGALVVFSQSRVMASRTIPALTEIEMILITTVQLKSTLELI